MKWLAKHRDLLRRSYGKNAPEPLPLREIARRLGWRVAQVCGAARHFGLASKHRFPRGYVRGRVLELHTRGLTASASAREIGVTHQIVRWHLRRLNLPLHPDKKTGEHGRERFFRNLQDAGYASPAEAARLCRACGAARLGWPCAETPTQALILGSLYGAPATVREVASAVGRSARTLSVAVLRLLRRGMLTREAAPRTVAGLEWRYSVAPGVRPGTREVSGRASYRPACEKRRVS